MLLKKKNIIHQHHSHIRRTGTVMLFLLAAGMGMAQYDAGMLNDIVAEYEKIYVKLDRDVYITGSTMQYRAFLADAGLVQANVRSRILYFELSGTGQAEILRWRVNLSNGSASGAYQIPASLPGGVYNLRAFTNWMRNGEPGYIFSTNILLFNISDESMNEIAVGTDATDYGSLVSFYPEGGNVIAHVPCRVGYRLNTGRDAPLPILLAVRENDSTAVVEVVPDSTGFGSFIFLPEAGKDYYAELTLEEGQTARMAMPYIEPYGYSLQVEEVMDGLEVVIHARNSDNGQRPSLHLMAVTGGSILVDTLFAMTSDSRRIHIPASSLQTGILYLTLYDSRRFSLGHRLYYIAGSPGEPAVRVKGIRDRYSRNEKIRLELDVEGFSPEDSATFAVSVSEQHPFQNLIGPPGIREYFLLSSEISEMPVSGRDLREMPAAKIQDMLLLVSASDYAWDYSNKNILADCLYEKEENGFILKGSLAYRATGEPVVDASIMISTTDSIAPRLIYASTGEDGAFYTLLNPSFDNKDVILQVADEAINPSDLTWALEQKTMAPLVLQQGTLMLSALERQYAEQSRNIQLIGEIFGNTLPLHGQEDGTVPEIAFLQPDMVVFPSDFTELVNFKEIADNILPTVRFVRRNRQYTTEVFNSNNQLWFPSNRILLNGVLFRDLDYIATLGSNDIVKVEIYNTNVLFGKLTLPGLIAIYTRDGLVPDQYLRNNTYVFHNVVPLNSASIPVPEGEESVEGENALPDFRQLLYWFPDLKIAGPDPVVLEFSASQLKGTYLIDIQGISGNGVPLGGRFRFTVE